MTSAVIFAGIGAAVAIGGTVYGIAQSQAAIDAANSVKRPKFSPIPIGDANTLVKGTNQQFLANSYNDWVSRFPLLAAGRNFAMGDMQNQLAGNVSPQEQAGVASAGLGNVNLGKGEFGQDVNLGLPIGTKQNRDRAYYNTMFAKNPEEWAGGLTGPQSADIAALNTNSQYAFDLGTFGQRLNSFNAGIQNSDQALAGGINAVSGTGLMLANYLTQPHPSWVSSYLNSDYYKTGSDNANYSDNYGTNQITPTYSSPFDPLTPLPPPTG